MPTLRSSSPLPANAARSRPPAGCPAATPFGIALIVVIGLALTGLATAGPAARPVPAGPSAVLFIGAGMGPADVTAPRVARGGLRG
ncbi:MAG TPA: hypothetical protein VFT43_01240, partial [Candidatus Polarisedimenticolia bacterium]|nr:hypothetical protein [Candidatus Polarisedimenticolia bacterium]